MAPAAIHTVFPLLRVNTNSTINIVNIVLNICSKLCDLAVTFILSLPLKYPLKTEAIDTKNTAGDNASNVYFASGISNAVVAIKSAPKNNIKVPINPITENVANATLNILCAPLWSPSAVLSATNLDIAFGTPIDDNVKSIAYIW